MAIKTKGIISRLTDLDTSWGFEYYLGLPHGTLRGGDIKVKSPFSLDREPSFSIYKHKLNLNGPYRFNDLSTGLKGDLIDLVGRLRSTDVHKPLPRDESFEIIRKDFATFLEGGGYQGPTQMLLNTKGRVVDWSLRNWSTADCAWWDQWGIPKKRAEMYNVAPMGEFIMHKTVDGDEKTMSFKNPLAFAYLTDTGELAKIYQPGMRGAKFIKVKDYYLQGYDQLKFDVDDLLIMSSLKDGMAFMELDFDGYEFVAPDSENVPIRKPEIDFLKTKYKRIRAFFDNDAAGKLAAKNYHASFGLDNINLDMSKDLSDSIRDYNQMLVKIELIPLL